MFTHIFMFDYKRKNRLQFFFHWKNRLFFSKTWFFINLLGPKDMILLLPQYLSEYLWDLHNSSFEVCRTRKYEKKNRPKYFTHWKVCLFFKNLWLQQPPRSWKKLWQATQYQYEQYVDPCKLFPEVYHTR